MGRTEGASLEKPTGHHQRGQGRTSVRAKGVALGAKLVPVEGPRECHWKDRRSTIGRATGIPVKGPMEYHWTDQGRTSDRAERVPTEEPKGNH